MPSPRTPMPAIESPSPRFSSAYCPPLATREPPQIRCERSSPAARLPLGSLRGLSPCLVSEQGSGRGPAQRNRAGAPDGLLHLDKPEPLCAGDAAHFRAVPDHVHDALHVQQIAGREVDEQERTARVG